MKNIKKLLVVICVLSLLIVGCAVAVFATEDSNVGSLDELNKLVTTAENASTPDAKYTAVKAVVKYLDEKTFDTNQNGYSEAMVRVHNVTVAAAGEYFEQITSDGVSSDVAYKGMTRAAELLAIFELDENTEGLAEVKSAHDSALAAALSAMIEDLDEDIETTRNTSTNRIAINKVNRVISECPLYGSDVDLTDILARFDELVALHDKATAANLAELDSNNSASNYDLPNYIVEDWEDCAVGSNANLGSRWNVQLIGSKNKMVIDQEENGNKYLTHRYLDKDNPTSSYTQTTFSSAKLDASKGFVIEFDITTFSELPDKNIIFETGSVKGAFFPPCYFVVNSNGDLVSNNKSTPILPGAIVKGEWLHVVIVFEPSTFVYELYVDGDHVATYDAKYNGNTTFDHADVAFRITGDKSIKGEYSVDNIEIYGGNEYRNRNRLKEMSDAEKFIFYVSYLTPEEVSVSDKAVAYNYAEKFIGKFWDNMLNGGEGGYVGEALENEALRAAVDSFVGFDLDILLADVRDKNLDSYISLVTALENVSRTVNTVANRKQMITEINTFVANNVDLIDREADKNGNGTPDYTEYNLSFNRIVRETEYDGNATTFVRYINRFQSAATLSAMQRYYDRAKELIDQDGIDINLINDVTNPYRNNFKDLVNAYNVYVNADATLKRLTLEDNSYKIVFCVKKISGFKTEEEWLANEELMEEYLFIIKDTVLGSDENGDLLYDEDYPGVREALDFFNEAFAYFYAKLQTEHVEYMQSILDLVLETDAYIEKMGMMSIIDRYIATNDIDYNDSRIIHLLNDVDTCKAELLLREEDYALLLVQNAVYFVNTVERMRTAQTYDEQLEYFEQAALLYFNIDINVEGAAEAVEIYDKFNVELKRSEEASVKFLEAVSIYKACETKDEKYAALVECYYNAQFAESSYEGVDEAMAFFEKEYNAYVNYAEAVNADLTLTGNAVGSFASCSGALTIVAIVIKKIFGV